MPALNDRSLNGRSFARLSGVHPDLVRVITAAAAAYEQQYPGCNVEVSEGLRTPARQAELVKAGASQTQNSRHLTGHAVDLYVAVNGEARWDWPLFSRLAAVVKAEAAKAGVMLEWGGDWKTLKDGPHFQLSRKGYP